MDGTLTNWWGEPLKHHAVMDIGDFHFPYQRMQFISPPPMGKTELLGMLRKDALIQSDIYLNQRPFHIEEHVEQVLAQAPPVDDEPWVVTQYEPGTLVAIFSESETLDAQDIFQGDEFTVEYDAGGFNLVQVKSTIDEKVSFIDRRLLCTAQYFHQEPDRSYDEALYTFGQKGYDKL